MFLYPPRKGFSAAGYSTVTTTSLGNGKIKITDIFLRRKSIFVNFYTVVHKVHIYLEYHSVCSLVRTWTPLSRKRVCPSPREGRGGIHSPAGKGVGGPNSDDWRKSLALCVLCAVVSTDMYDYFWTKVSFSLVTQPKTRPPSNIVCVSVTFSRRVCPRRWRCDLLAYEACRSFASAACIPPAFSYNAENKAEQIIAD